MDIQAILQAITTVGFPIVCCGAMMWYVKYSTDQNRDEVSKLNEQHKQEMTEVTQAINNNTMALQKLCDLMQKEGAN
jgi:hypothetical protein